MVITLVVIACVLLTGLAEWLHHRRIAKVAFMAFGAEARPRRWAQAAPFIRLAGIGLLCWGLLTLLKVDGSYQRRPDSTPGNQHLVIALDVSPSMHIPDSGPTGKLARSSRAAEVLSSLLDRLDTTKIRISIVAFYTTAKPVIIEARDMAVVNNVIRDLPLEYAFKDGLTDMYAGVREAVRLARGWQPGSTTLVVVSDGDTLPEAKLEDMPASIGDAIVLGVGNPYSGTSIADHSSRQDAPALKSLAARLRGQYHDANAQHLPSGVLTGLRMVSRQDGRALPLRTLALASTAIGSVLLALLWPVLGRFGAPAATAAAEYAVRGLAEPISDEPVGPRAPGRGTSRTTMSGPMAARRAQTVGAGEEP